MHVGCTGSIFETRLPSHSLDEPPNRGALFVRGMLTNEREMDAFHGHLKRCPTSFQAAQL